MTSYSSRGGRKPPAAILPCLGWFILFLIIPLCLVMLFSVLHRGLYGQIVYHLDLSNYRRLFEPVFLRIIWHSFLLAFFTTAVCLAAGFPLAYLMARSGAKMKSALLGLIIVPFWTNFIIRVYALRIVLGQSGIINHLLLQMHLIAAPLQFIDNTTGVAIGMIYNYLPFMVLPLFVTLEKLDFTLLDAAYDLGANKFQSTLRVLFPLSIPGVVTGSLFVFIPAFGEFIIPELLGGARNMYVGSLITETFLKTRDWPFGSALSSFLVALAMGSFVFVFWRSSQEKNQPKVSLP